MEARIWVRAASGPARLDGGRDLRAQYVLGAIGTPCAELAQRAADRHDPETIAVGVDELADHRCSGSCSRAKKADAARRISMVRSSSPTLRLSSRTSLDDSVVTPGAPPSSTAAPRIHLRSVSALIPTRPATALIAAYSDG